MMRSGQRAQDIIAEAIDTAGSLLCIGIDPHHHFLDGEPTDESLVRWCLPLIEEGAAWCAAFKFNLAFFEAYGADGWRALAELVRAVPSGRVTILDGKRGDIGSTAIAYARSSFDVLGADAVTVNPYMGLDAVEPFARPGNVAFVLALTSNAGAQQFQLLHCNGTPLYQHVIRTFLESPWQQQLGFVVGATMPEQLAEVRKLVGRDVPLLIPGIGTQGGDIDATLVANQNGLALINISRGLLEPYRDGGITQFRDVVKRYHQLLARR
jgi:orotidine-5'-phosphate decarboxylase